ncbi:glycosyltransferase, partial [candidate division KSB1 bacterium]
FEIEIHIIDNNSKDHTVNKITSFFESNNRAYNLIKNEKNLGFARGVNQGIKASSGNFIMIMNPDVFIINGFFDKITLPFKKHSDLGAAAPQHLNKDNKIIPSCRRLPDRLTVLWEIFLLSRIFKKSRIFNKWKMPDFDHETELLNCQPMGSCMFFPRSTMEKTGYMDERFFLFFNDVDYCRRILDAGKKILFYPDAKIIHYKGHSIYKNRVKSIFYSHLGFYRYINKYSKNIFEKFLNLPIFLLLSLSGLLRIILLLPKEIKK